VIRLAVQPPVAVTAAPGVYLIQPSSVIDFLCSYELMDLS
jgi:hypothetical protein